jgi:hypothetical protein
MEFRHEHRGFSTVVQSNDGNGWKSKVVSGNGDILEEWEGLYHPSSENGDKEEYLPFRCEECQQWHFFANNNTNARLAAIHFQQCSPFGWLYRL